MSTRTDRRVPASTYLIHYFGRGLVDEGRCYVVERFKALACGDIRRWPVETGRSKKDRGRSSPEVASLAVEIGTGRKDPKRKYYKAGD